jgi:hypothetical protein
MIAASSLAFPGSKTLAAWWSQLAPFHPLQMWVGHLFIHRLEVLAEVVLSETVDPLHLMLLRAIDRESRCEENTSSGQTGALSPQLFLERLDQHLHLTPGLILRLLADLRGEGLLTPAPLPTLTESGRLSLAKGTFPKTHWQRRELAFVERLRPDGSRLLPPHFLALAGGAGQRWQPDANLNFELAWLKQSAGQPPTWRDTFAFPQEIRTIAAYPEDQGQEPPPWQRVAVDRPERLLVAAAATGTSAPEKILVFAARQDGWELRSDKPIGTMAWTGRQEFADLAESANWSKAWQTWCHPRHYPADEVAACTLTQTGPRLDLLAPAALHARLTAGKSELLKGDTWLLAGEGYLRSAANVRLRVSEQST